MIGQKATSASAQRHHGAVCPEASPGPSLLLLLLRAGQRHQALGKAALCVHPWCSTRGELQPWLFQHGCSFVFLSLISPLQASRALLIVSLVAP